MPSIVTTSDPSAWTASTVQDFTARPSMWTVQAPHCDVSHPMLVPVRPSSSRIKSTSSSRGSTLSRLRDSPLMFKEMLTPITKPPSLVGNKINYLCQYC